MTVVTWFDAVYKDYLHFDVLLAWLLTLKNKPVTGNPMLKIVVNLKVSSTFSSCYFDTFPHSFDNFHTFPHSFGNFDTIPHSFGNFDTIPHSFDNFHTIPHSFSHSFGPLLKCRVCKKSAKLRRDPFIIAAMMMTTRDGD